MWKKTFSGAVSSPFKSTYLDRYFGAHRSCKLVNNLRIQAASIINISNQDWEWLRVIKHTFVSLKSQHFLCVSVCVYVSVSFDIVMFVIF